MIQTQTLRLTLLNSPFDTSTRLWNTRCESVPCRSWAGVCVTCRITHLLPHSLSERCQHFLHVHQTLLQLTVDPLWSQMLSLLPLSAGRRGGAAVKSHRCLKSRLSIASSRKNGQHVSSAMKTKMCRKKPWTTFINNVPMCYMWRAWP